MIEAETGFKDVEGWELELSSFASVLSFAEKFKKEGRSLDILVANAGVAMPDFQQTQDGWETSYDFNLKFLVCTLH